MASTALQKAWDLDDIRAAGKVAVHHMLEAMVNAEAITVEQASQVWHDAFGGRLVAMKEVH